MLSIVKERTASIILTLSESKTIQAPYYWVVFTSLTTSDTVALQFFYSDDISPYPDRYNEFNLGKGSFDTIALGQYLYRVYETSSSATITDFTGLNVVESGRMDLSSVTTINRIGYTAPTVNKKGYAG